MKSEKNYPNSRCPLALLVLAAALMVAVGCQSTVTPRTVASTAASWDAGGQNSGVLGFTNYAGADYCVITTHARDRYNALVAAYGSRFAPPLAQDDGVRVDMAAPGQVWLGYQAAEHFARMERWRRSEPPK